MKLGYISPKGKVHDTDSSGETACGCGSAKKVWNGNRARITCIRCDFMLKNRPARLS